MMRVGREKFSLEEQFSAYFVYFYEFDNIIELTYFFLILGAFGLRQYAERTHDANGRSNPSEWDQLLDYCRTMYALA
eukprot:4835594-Prymnesium_polylepis.1